MYKVGPSIVVLHDHECVKQVFIWHFKVLTITCEYDIWLCDKTSSYVIMLFLSKANKYVFDQIKPMIKKIKYIIR